MEVGPPKALQWIARVLLPPARREEVLGDLEERFHLSDSKRALWEYLWDLVFAVPLVIVSQVIRTADPRLLLLEALALYSAFAGAAWVVLGGRAPAFLNDEYGLLRVALPTLAALLALVLADVYRAPKRSRPMRHVEQVCIALGVAFLSQVACRAEVALPRWIMACGAAMGLLLLPAIRLLFAAGDDKPASN